MSAIYDLHCHSNASDGILRPEALVSRAGERGVEVLALTDHDTVAGLSEARQAAADCKGLTLICGVEFSSHWGRQPVHLVGLGIAPQSDAISHSVRAQQAVREHRAEAIAERLQKAGIRDALAGAKRFADGAGVGRPHFARYLVEQGYVPHFKAAFKQYLGTGKSGDVQHAWPGFEQVIGWIRDAGGVAVLAHPDKYGLTRTKLRAMIEDFIAAGGDAMEVISGRQGSEVTRNLAGLAGHYGLYASCGSDFHTPDQPWQELGAFGTLPADCRPVWQLWE